MREVARSRNLLSGFVTTLKRLFESVVGTLFCLLLYVGDQVIRTRVRAKGEGRAIKIMRFPT